MDPAGGLVEKLNAIAARPYEVAAAVARYEPRGSAAQRLLDAAAGGFFEDPNDLLVPTEGGARLGAAPPVPEKDVIRFGPGGNAGAGAIVHHLNLFAQRETKERIKIFLEGKEDDAAVGARVGARHRTNRLSRGPGQPKSPSKHARSASSPRRFELVLIGGKGGTPAHLLASFGGARVVEPFETKGGAAGERMRVIIAMHERVLAALDGGGSEPLPAAAELREYGTVLFATLFPGAVRRLWDEARTAAKGALEVVFTPGLDWIADKPWELAWDSSRRRFLADDAVLVRGVLGAPASPPRALPGPRSAARSRRPCRAARRRARGRAAGGGRHSRRSPTARQGRPRPSRGSRVHLARGPSPPPLGGPRGRPALRGARGLRRKGEDGLPLLRGRARTLPRRRHGPRSAPPHRARVEARRSERVRDGPRGTHGFLAWSGARSLGGRHPGRPREPVQGARRVRDGLRPRSLLGAREGPQPGRGRA